MQPVTHVKRHWSCARKCRGSGISASALAPHLPARREDDAAPPEPCLTINWLCPLLVLGVNRVKGCPQSLYASKVGAMDDDVEEGGDDWDPTTEPQPRAPVRA
jgi:hypothetical protein